jgi:hypothetical protein
MWCFLLNGNKLGNPLIPTPFPGGNIYSVSDGMCSTVIASSEASQIQGIDGWLCASMDFNKAYIAMQGANYCIEIDKVPAHSYAIDWVYISKKSGGFIPGYQFYYQVTGSPTADGWATPGANAINHQVFCAPNLSVTIGNQIERP